jgi:hypothetical protein
MTLTPEEKRAIKALKRVARQWPKTLWLFSAGDLEVMRLGPNGERMMTSQGGVDQAYIVATIDGIPNDGGDWD